MQFTAWPEMLAWPYLIQKGFLPYQDIAIAHNPLLIFALTIFYKIFGVGVLQLQTFTFLLIVFIELLLYWVINKLYSKKLAVITLIAYTILLITYSGWGLWFDLALVPFAILLFYFVKKDNWLMVGIIFALGFLTKQTFVYFLIPILINKVDIKKFVFGVIPIFSLFTLYLLTFNLMSDYWHWAIEFGVFYLPHAKGQVLLPTLKQLAVSVIPFSLLPFNLYLLPWVLAGLMGIYPRFELFHFQPALPFLALALSQSLTNKNIKIKYFGFLITFFITLLFIRKIYREQNFETRFYENDVQKIVSKLITRNPQSHNLYVINYWDNIYALTNTVPPKPLIPYIPWYLNYGNNKQLIINNLQVKLPDALVVNDRKNLNFEKLQTFIDRYYHCSLVENEVEVCFKN